MIVSLHKFGSYIINKKSVNYSQVHSRFSIKASASPFLSFFEISRH